VIGLGVFQAVARAGVTIPIEQKQADVLAVGRAVILPQGREAELPLRETGAEMGAVLAPRALRLVRADAVDLILDRGGDVNDAVDELGAPRVVVALADALGC